MQPTTLDLKTDFGLSVVIQCGSTGSKCIFQTALPSGQGLHCAMAGLRGLPLPERWGHSPGELLQALLVSESPAAKRLL